METKSVVAFIDILGFSEIVAANERSSHNEIFNDLYNALNESIVKTTDIQKLLLTKVEEEMDEKIVEKFKHKQFSDNVYFSFDYNDDSELDLAFYFVVSICILYQRTMLAKGYYVRGGIAEGQNFVGDNLIFSKALIRAYELESKWANYPRIVIDKPLIEKVKLNISDLSVIIMNRISHNIIMDWTETIFINPFHLTLGGNLAATNFYNEIVTKNPNVLEKINQLPRDITDEELLRTAKENVANKIAVHENDNRIYEKYLWLSEFIKWTSKEKSNLEFFEITL